MATPRSRFRQGFPMNQLRIKTAARLLACAATLFGFAHAAHASSINPKAQQILEQSIKTYGTLQSYQDSSVSVDNSPAGKFVVRQVISFKAPRFLNVVTMQGKYHLVQNYDGRNYNSTHLGNSEIFWTQMPLPDTTYGRHVLLQYQPAGMLFTPFLAGVNPWQAPFGMAISSLQLGAVTTLDHVKVNTIIATPDDDLKTQFIYLIGQKDHLVRRITVKGKTVDGDEYTTTETHSRIKINQPFAAGTFKFHVPAGAPMRDILEEMRGDTLQKGERAPNFLALDLHNKKISLKQYKGKVLLLDFWATWCVACRQEMPYIKSLYQKYHSQGLEIVGVSQDMQRPDLRDFVNKHRIPWRQIWDSNSALSLNYKVEALPSNVLIAPDGKILAVNQSSLLLDTAICDALKKYL